MTPPKKQIDVSPRGAVPGARITLHISHYDLDRPRLPEVRIGGLPARVVAASSRRVDVVVPEEITESTAEVTVEGIDYTAQLHIARAIANEFHQVDNPVIDDDGNLYVTDSGPRGQRVPVSIFRIRPDGTREPFVSGIVNATSMTLGPDRRLYVSSRFEGKVYRIDGDGRATAIGSDLGVACGLAFASDGTLFVGDRSGTILRLDPATGAARPHAELPPSVAAFHLASADDNALFVTAPTMASYDNVYRVNADGKVEVVTSDFGRPQGVAVRNRNLYVVDAAAGWNGVYKVVTSESSKVRPRPTRMIAGMNLIGLAFHPGGGMVLVSNDTAYRLEKGFRV